MTLDRATLSKTTLKPEQSTRGHSHPHEEAYLFADFADIQLGNEPSTMEQWQITPGEIVHIPRNVFHMVSNPSTKDEATFYSLFNGDRSDSVYEAPDA